MYKYEGQLLHESHDDDGILEVIETQGVRSLHFGSPARQSSIRLTHPDNLELSYVRAMMAWLLFTDAPEKVLIIGLGGGSITKYLLHHFEQVQIKAVEYRKSVLKIARSHFELPLDPRLKVIIEDGGHYLRQRSESLENQFNILILDAFDHEGMADSLCNPAFFDACKNVLRSDGILILNLWRSDKALFDKISWWLGQSFNARLLFLPVPDKGNIIGFAFAENVACCSMKHLRERAKQLETCHQIEFSAFLREFKRHNLHSTSKIITS